MKGKGVSRREFLRHAGLAGAVLSLAACASPPPAVVPTREEERPSAAKTEIALWGWWEARMQIFQAAADDFSESNPDAEVVVETFAGDELWPKVYASVPAGTGPALMKMQTTNFFQLRDQELLIELPEDIFPDSFLRTQYPNYSWDAYGRYCVPEGDQPAVFTYNRMMFEEAGLDPDVPPRTWEEFFSAAEKLTVRDANGVIQRAGVQFDNWLTVANPLYQLGGSLLKRDTEPAQANMTGSEMRDAHQFLLDAARKHNVWDPEFPYYSDAIGNEQAAMSIGEAWVVGTWRSDFPDTFEHLAFAALPTPTGEADPYFGRKNAVLNLALMENRPEEEIEIATRFLEYLVKERTDTQLALATIAGLVPAHAELMTSPEVTADPFLSLGTELVLHQYDAIDVPNALNTVVTDTLNLMLLQDQPIDQALETGQAKLQELIDNGDLKYLEIQPPLTS